MQFCAYRRRRSALLIVFLCIFSLIFCINVSAGSYPFRFNLFARDSYSLVFEDLNGSLITYNYDGWNDINASYSDGFTTFSNTVPITTDRTIHYFRKISCKAMNESAYPCAAFPSSDIYFFVTLSLQGSRAYFESGSLTSAEIQFFTNAQGSSSIWGSYVSNSSTLRRGVGELTYITVLFKVNFSNFQSQFIYGFNVSFSTSLRERYPDGVSSDSYSVKFRCSDGFLNEDRSQAENIYQGTLNALDDFFNSGPTPPVMDYSSIDAMNQAEAGLRDALPDLGDASSDVLAGFQSALGDQSFLAGMRGIKYMLEASTSTGFLKILLTCSISFGAIAFLVGLGLTVIRRS